MLDAQLKVHPAAAVFPMLSEDELADLAEDIKANGLLHPIVLDADGETLIDGRNRLAACKLAHVEPTFERLNGHDPVAFILSENIHRRHLTEGQKAIAVVRAVGLCKLQEERGAKGEAARNGGVEAARITQAIAIVEYAPDLADQVMAIGLPFSAAYQRAIERREEQQSREAAVARAEAQLRRLRAAAPDLAARVVDEQLDLAEALGALKVRQQKEADARRATSELADTTLTFLDPGSSGTVSKRADQIIATLDASSLAARPDFSAARFERCSAVLATISQRLTGQEASHGSNAVPIE